MDKIGKIIAAMSLEDKARQLTQLNALFEASGVENTLTGAEIGIHVTQADLDGYGSYLGCGTAEQQKRHMARDPHGLPLLFMLDVIHGYRTIFPIPLALGCTFDPDLIEACAEMSAAEAKCDGVHVTFSPMADLARDARWGRVMETTGEDPYLNGEMSKAFIRGYHKGGLACCVKHFAAYGLAEAGRDYNTTEIGAHALKEFYLKAYRACLDEKPEMFMTSFNLLNGVPMNGHTDLLIDTLRKEWGFDGVTISDYSAIHEMMAHGFAENLKSCAEIAANNEVDIEMMSGAYLSHLAELVRTGKVPEATVDRMVRRVLELKEKCGLLDENYAPAELPQEEKDKVFLCEKHRDLARRAAERSFVLLKNNGALPLDKNANIALVGPFADEQDIIGAWQCYGKPSEAVTVKAGVEAFLGRAVPCEKGCDGGLSTTAIDGVKAAVKAAKRADMVVLCIGEPSQSSGECTSRTNLELSAAQKQLLLAVKKTGKKIVSVVFGGRGLVLNEVAEVSDAVLIVWQPGTECGNAVANVLFGAVAPSGKLTVSLPRATGQCPIYYNRYNTGRPIKVDEPSENFNPFLSCYRDCKNAPLYPFGWGLSYTKFAYSDLELSSDTMRFGGTLTVSVTVQNVGDRAGEEVVQLYTRDVCGSVARPVKELKAFRRIKLQAGQMQKVTFTVTEDMLKFFTASGEEKAEAGAFTVMVGGNSEEVLSQNFTLQ